MPRLAQLLAGRIGVVLFGFLLVVGFAVSAAHAAGAA